MRTEEYENIFSKFVKYFLVFFIVAVTGFTYFYGSVDLIVIGMLLAMISFVFFNRKLDKYVFYIIGAFLIIEILQIISFGNFSYKTFSGTFVRLLFGYFVVKVLSTDFGRVYSNIIVFFSVVSLVFYILYFFPPVTEFIVLKIAPFFETPFKDEEGFYQSAPNIIIFTYDLYGTDMDYYRNAGPFWEAGAFAFFIVTAMMFNLMRGDYILSKPNLILIIALITTFSTAGYISFLVFLFFYVLLAKNVRFKFLLFFIVPILAYYLYFELSFLNEKILIGIAHGQSNYADATTSRIGSAIVDFTDFLKSPLIGWGRGEMRFGGRQYAYFTEEMHRNNGVTNLLASYGIVIFIMYFYFYYNSFKAYSMYYDNSKFYGFVGLAVVFLLGFSQAIFLRPFLNTLLFLMTVYILKPPDDDDQEDEDPDEENTLIET